MSRNRRGEVKRLDRRTGVYSLGATLFHLLTGRPPFVAQSTADIILVLMEEPPSVGSSVRPFQSRSTPLSTKCLAKGTIAALCDGAGAYPDDLGRYLAKESIVGNRVSPGCAHAVAGAARSTLAVTRRVSASGADRFAWVRNQNPDGYGGHGSSSESACH